MDEVREWTAANAHDLATGPADAALAALVGEAEVVGLGESTRQGREVVEVAHRILRVLVAERGFRALAVADDESVWADLDAYVRTGTGDPAALLADAWGPWRNAEVVEVLEWLRAFNADHPDDPVRLFGLTPPAARQADYDEVVRLAPELADELRAHYDPIRTAHVIGEHVQRARGIHPGRPFVDHAVAARDLVAALPGRAPALAERIVAFHRDSIAGGQDLDAHAAALASAIGGLPGRTVFWDGFAHTADAAAAEVTPLGTTLRSVGSRLRERLGPAYRSLVIGFEHGRIHTDTVPPPPADFADAVLSNGREYLLDLHAPRPPAVADWLRGPHRLRVIAGVYDSAHDADHHVVTGPLDEWFDVLVRIGEITPTRPLG